MYVIERCDGRRFGYSDFSGRYIWFHPQHSIRKGRDLILYFGCEAEAETFRQTGLTLMEREDSQVVKLG